MNILVTGGSGFIGSNFIQYWLEHYDDSIINFDKLTYAANPHSLEDFNEDLRYSFIEGDICDQPHVDEIMGNVDLVVHFAAESHVDRSIQEPAAFVITNVLGTQVLIDSATKHDVRFHHISTDEVFGDLELNTKDQFQVDTPYAPHSPYSASKAGADHLVRSYGTTFNTRYTISNCSNNYGPYQHPEKLIPLFITNLIDNKQVPLYGDGKNVRDWIHVEDHCRAIDMIINNGTIGNTYLVGGNTEISNIEITHILLGAFGKDESCIDHVEDRKGHDRRYSIDSSYIQKELGWRPRVSFEKGIAQTIDWYMNNEDWWRPLKT